jgi:hypothetical protein
MKRAVLYTLLTLFGLLRSLHAQSPAVTSAKDSYHAGETISITFTNGPGNAKDWIGIYPVNVEPGSVGSTIWFYVDGTKSGANGLASGTIQFVNGLSTPGTWVAYLLENDGYTKLAQVSFTVVPTPSVTTDKSIYATNETIQVTFANGPGNAKDWVGIYPDGAVPGGPASTIWNYVNGSHSATSGKTNGTIVFANGLSNAGKWVAYFLLNDGYTQLASVAFTVGVSPSLSIAHSNYLAGSPITFSFTNGPAHPKDWIAIYPDGATPGGPASTLWQYTDANGGKAGKSSGSVTFGSGLTNAGAYVAYFLENDGYNILASSKFSILAPDAPLLWVDHGSYLTGQAIVAAFTNAPGNPKDWVGIYPAGVKPGSVGSTVWHYLDGTQSGSDVFTSGTVTFADGLRSAGDWVAFLLENDGYNVLAQESFHVTAAPHVSTNNLILGTPLYFENFDSTTEGGLPAGWTTTSYTDALDDNFDLGDLNSKSYANWVVVSADRFNSPLLSYTSHTPTSDYKRVLSSNPDNVVNGVTITNLGTGNILFGDSGYRSGRSQVLYIFTPDYNLSGKTNVAVSFHSLYEQNQDSIGALEYTIDGGTNWFPVVYLLDKPDVLKDAQGNIDVSATFTTEYPSGGEAVAYYDDPVTGETKGGTYGTFIAAPITQDLAPFISARVNDDPVESKRVEYFRLPKADNQAHLQFRFAYAGTDSWYWGIDDFGIYGSPTAAQGPITLSVSRTDDKVTISWTGGTGHLQKSTSLNPTQWLDVSVPTGATSVTETITGSGYFYRVNGQ